jgi:hypothetical protein
MANYDTLGKRAADHQNALDQKARISAAFQVRKALKETYTIDDLMQIDGIVAVEISPDYLQYVRSVYFVNAYSTKPVMQPDSKVVEGTLKELFSSALNTKSQQYQVFQYLTGRRP